LRALHDLGPPLCVPRFLRTLSGAELSAFGASHVAVFSWIDAVNLGPDWENALPELAALLGHLHAHTSDIMARVPRLPIPPEDFALPFETTLSADLAALATLPPTARPGLRALRDLVAPYEALVLRHLQAVRVLRAGVLDRRVRHVVCHTDAHGANVLRDVDARLWIVDWEMARLAPPEHDLWMLLVRRPDVLAEYRRTAGRHAQLDPDVLSFYVLRRVLEDVAVDVHAVVHEHRRPEEDANTLDILTRFVLPALEAAEHDCVTVTQGLDLS
jgi:Ser/Thr protein kinase RdoA (MazF antagonist)